MEDRHSLLVLGQLREYDSFLDSLRTICDMGCGTGEDIEWWATLTTRDDPPEPYNYKCFAVDKDPIKLSKVPDLPNIYKINKDFNESVIIPVSVDLIWSHDSLQYSHDPLATLKNWNNLMTTNGMLVISVPQSNGVEYNRYYSRTYSHCYYNYTPTNLIYMLAVNGFDCRDAYLLKKYQDPWIHMAVYKSDVPPMDPATTSWIDLLDTGLLHPSIVNSINKHGHLRQEEIIMPWLDKENYFIDYVSAWTEVPEEAGEPKIEGVFNETIESEKTTVKQAKKKVKETDILTPVSITRPPKGRFVK
jgi:SAM-dependent methyltransferase